MKKQTLALLLCLILILCPFSFVNAETGEQDWSKYTWDLTEFFLSNEAFLQTCSSMQEGIVFLNSCKGKLHNPDVFIQFNNTLDEVYEKLLDVYYYASLSFQKNYTSSEATASYVKANDIYNSFFAAYRMFNNEIATMDDAKFSSLLSDRRFAMMASTLKSIREDPENADYNDDKKLISELNTISDFESVYSTLKDGELGAASILDEEGNLVPASEKYLFSSVESVRRDAVDALNYPYLSKQNTFASLYDKHVRQSLANNKYEGYDSTLSAQLENYQVSRKAYDLLMSNTMNNLTVINEKYDIQRKALGYEKLESYNMYQNYLPSSQKIYTMEEARRDIIAAAQPLGEEYISVLNKAFDERWIDAKPGNGKYSGGFTMPTTKHPFILVNFTGTLSDVGDLAHELGHAVHMYLSAQNQPPQYQNAPYVSSEIASTTNETLYYQYKLKQAKDDDEILYYTAQMESYMFGYGIEVMKQAKIEEIAQDAVLNGEVLTADFMNKTTMDVLKQFYGPAVNVAESSKIYWAKIPHYYSDFYVFNYAMSYTATNMVVKDINAGKASRFLSFLKAGSSKDALELIKEMGIDMESETPYKTLYQDYRSYLEKERELLCKNGQQMSDDGSIQVVYKGNLINFENKPVSIDYVTLVDAEALLRQIGLPVSMENGLTASADGTELRFQEGQQNASVNGVNVPMQLAAQTVNNKLFVPIRFIADQLGLSISYNERTKTVVLK